MKKIHSYTDYSTNESFGLKELFKVKVLKYLATLKLEAKENKEMIKVFSKLLLEKLHIDSSSKLPTEEEYYNALKKLKDIPRIAPIVTILLAVPIPFASLGYIGIAKTLEKIFNYRLLPNSITTIKDTKSGTQ